jgi:hypothetical protein
MKQVLFAFTLVLLTSTVQAQHFKWGAKVGIGTSSLRSESIEFPSALRLSIQEAKIGYYAGLFGSFNRGSFLLQPELLFNSNRVDYSFRDFKKPTIIDTIRTERYSQLDVPVLLGAKVGPLLLKAGPVAHIHLNSSSGLTSISGLTEKWRSAMWGYQIGIGLGFSSRMHLDIRYEGNFDKWGTHIKLGGQDFNFSQKPSRWLVNIGYAF